MTNNVTSQIFWLENWEGEANPGVFTRCNLNTVIRVMNMKGVRIVGIKIDLDETWNLELIVEKDNK